MKVVQRKNGEKTINFFMSQFNICAKVYKEEKKSIL